MPGRTRVKICGITTVEALDAAADAGADAVGFVFVPASPRFIEPEKAWPLVNICAPMVTTVGLYQNLSVDGFSDIFERCPTDLTQLHGTEPVKTVQACGPQLIKSVKFSEAMIDDELKRWEEVDEVDAILVDGSAGGEGVSFDWSLLKAAIERTGVRKPIVLAGGLTPENVGEAIRAVRPWAVDVSSGVERERGMKDPALIEAFCRAVREADAR